ncbi:hypothetical protein [Mariniplasma anaerobium]|uniref:Uncharacterized protein n=1 Tax=Mariniplasma anaerobium TaxID=2735436 RepID=A0A7U9THR4_9MOLU|nr:hypothetical protein [Mariniplasma anaerobium]BCR36748.1 hypothetical protein MPAN_016410 [Mariniplasma anaerobium]
MDIKKNSKQKRGKVFKWIKDHKVELSYGVGILALTGVGISFGANYKKQARIPITAIPIIPVYDTNLPIYDVIDEVSKTINCSSKSPHFRKDHIRHLGNRNASTQKIKEALEKGIELLLHETYVKQSYVKAN